MPLPLKIAYVAAALAGSTASVRSRGGLRGFSLRLALTSTAMAVIPPFPRVRAPCASGMAHKACSTGSDNSTEARGLGERQERVVRAQHRFFLRPLRRVLKPTTALSTFSQLLLNLTPTYARHVLRHTRLIKTHKTCKSSISLDRYSSTCRANHGLKQSSAYVCPPLALTRPSPWFFHR